MAWTKNFARGAPTKFGRRKTPKIQRDFRQFLTLIANISGMDGCNENLKSTWSTIFQLLLGKNWRTFESHCTAFLAAFLVVKTIDDLVLWAVSKLAHTLYGIVYVTETYMSEMWVVLQYVCFSYLCCNTVMFFSCVNCVFWTVHCRHLTQIRTQNFATPRRKSIRESGCCRQTLWLAYWHCDMQTVLYSSSSMLE